VILRGRETDRHEITIVPGGEAPRRKGRDDELGPAGPAAEDGRRCRTGACGRRPGCRSAAANAGLPSAIQWFGTPRRPRRRRGRIGHQGATAGDARARDDARWPATAHSELTSGPDPAPAPSQSGPGSSRVRTGAREGDAHQEAPKLRDPIDLLFIDADKKGYADYLTNLLPLVRPGGLVVAHDINRGMADPQFLSAITTNPDLESVFLSTSWGLSVTLKKR
jgi:hypothetical protein